MSKIISKLNNARKITYKERATFYDIEYDTNIDQPFLRSHITNNIFSVLEIPAGSGRNLNWLMEMNCNLIVADKEPEMVKQLQNKINQKKSTHQIFAKVADLRDFQFNSTFDIIIVPQEAFQLLLKKEDAIQSLYTLRKHLNEGGKIILDIARFSHTSPKKHTPLYYSPNIQDEELLHEWTKVNKENELVSRYRIQHHLEDFIYFKFFYLLVSKNYEHAFYTELYLRYYRYFDLCKMFNQTGLTIEKTYRNYNFDTFNPEKTTSSKMIFILSKGE